MTVLELLVAVTMLLVFTGTVLVVSSTGVRFLMPLNQGSNVGVTRSNGLLIDQYELRVTMRRLVSLLEQPGISRDQMLVSQAGQRPIARSLSVEPEQACVVNPVSAWGLQVSDQLGRLPAGYRLCVWSTSVREASLNQLLRQSPAEPASPGVYVMQALPEQLTTSHLPIRILFCRPKPFC